MKPKAKVPLSETHAFSSLANNLEPNPILLLYVQPTNLATKTSTNTNLKKEVEQNIAKALTNLNFQSVVVISRENEVPLFFWLKENQVRDIHFYNYFFNRE